jgi:hypothetical protein
MNEPDTSCELNAHELCGTLNQGHEQLNLPLKRPFTTGDKLEMSWKWPSHLTKNLTKNLASVFLSCCSLWLCVR